MQPVHPAVLPCSCPLLSIILVKVNLAYAHILRQPHLYGIITPCRYGGETFVETCITKIMGVFILGGIKYFRVSRVT